MNTPASPPRSVDLFCAVIDNFGDIGVCWRLARQLTREHQLTVRLWVDDLKTFQKLAPSLNPELPVQFLDSVEIRLWSSSSLDGVEPADLVIEGFGCPLPEHFLDAMARRTSPVRWVNLEYLSAEPWTLDCHLQRSRHPRLPLEQVFFFPGFDTGSGGLLRESSLLARRDEFLATPDKQKAFWERLGLPEARAAERRVSLFAYENPSIPELLNALADDSAQTLLIIPEGRALPQASLWCDMPLSAGGRFHRGSLSIAVLPFLSPEDYDQLLWASDLNAVRGEDSFIRAHWAGKPLLWQIYPQEDEAHLIKLRAWLTSVTGDFPGIWAISQEAWNQSGKLPPDWPEFLAQLPDIALYTKKMNVRLGIQTDLATKLMVFCGKE